jgi:hypothetical protein
VLKLESFDTVSGNVNGTAALENSLAVPQKFKYNPAM